MNRFVSDTKRLFFGFEVYAPWPEDLPDARTLKAKHRHLTIAFLGDTSYKQIRSLIPKMPKPPFRVGPAAVSDACLCLPRRDPRVVTWHVNPFGEDTIADYQKEVVAFLEEKGYPIDKREFLKHITLGRSPFKEKEWKKNFRPLPLYLKNLHLYESFKDLRYEPIWTHDLLPPFKEVKEGVFHLHGESFQQIFLNAQIALAFKCPSLLPFLDPHYQVRNLHDGGIRLRAILNKAHGKGVIGVPDIIFPDEGKQEGGLLTWELWVRS